MSSVSIIIPVHNTAAYLETCIDSVLNQTLKDIEIILVENGSSDNSYRICLDLAFKDSRIKVLQIDVADLSTARNRGIEMATSEYIGFVDSDDYIDPDMYSTMYDCATKYNADIVCCNFMYVFPDGRKLQNFADTGNIRLISPKEMIVSIFQERISSSSWSKIYKKDIFSKWTFPEGYTFEDHRLIYKIIADCNICVYIDKSLYYYLQREDSIVHDLTFKRRYHYFLADYERILFAQNYPEFSDTEKARIIKKQFDICFNNHFGGFMTVPGAPEQTQMINDMKHKLLSFLKSGYISRHDRKALITIKYMWHIYDWTHFWKFRRRRARKAKLKSIQSGKPGMHVFNG